MTTTIRSVLACSLALGGLVCSLLAPRPALGHGDWGHVHVTGWAIENLPHGELRDLFAEPEVFSAALYGAAFPDSGYWADEPPHREFAEYSHWEPFVQGFIEYIRDNYPPPFETLEQRQLVGFLMGCAAHGLQDEVFDSLFLLQLRERDGQGQDQADGGTDFLLYDEGHIRFPVEEFVPTDVLLDLYADLSQEIDAQTIREGVDAQTRSYVNPTLIATFSMAFVEETREILPWGSRHYLDHGVPGSLRAEINPTIRYMEAIWERLHGRWDESDLVVHAFPEDPRRLRGHRSDSVDSWVTMVFGRAVSIESSSGALFDEQGNPIDAELTGTRWGHPYPRLVRFIPNQDLDPGAYYTARFDPGAEIIGGGETTQATELDFQVGCTDETEEDCPDLGPIDVPVIDGSFTPAPPSPTPRFDDHYEDDACAVVAPQRGAAWPLIAAFSLMWLARRRAK